MVVVLSFSLGYWIAVEELYFYAGKEVVYPISRGKHSYRSKVAHFAECFQPQLIVAQKVFAFRFEEPCCHISASAYFFFERAQYGVCVSK